MDWRMFSPSGLSAALSEQGHVVSKRTIDRWKAGTARPQAGDLRAIRDLVGIQTQREAAPSVTRRLLQGVIALERKVGVTPPDLAQASSEADAVLLEMGLEADALVGGGIAQPPRTLGEQAADRGNAPADGSAGSKPRKRRSGR